MNKCTLLGRTTKDPDISFTPDGLCVARFSLAVTRRYKKDEADFINCVCFGKLAEIFQKFVKKGDKICVAGRIQTGSYNNREGKKVYTTDIVVEDLDMWGSKAAEAVWGSGSNEAGGFQERLLIMAAVQNDFGKAHGAGAGQSQGPANAV